MLVPSWACRALVGWGQGQGQDPAKELTARRDHPLESAPLWALRTCLRPPGGSRETVPRDLPFPTRPGGGALVNSGAQEHPPQPPRPPQVTEPVTEGQLQPDSDSLSPQPPSGPLPLQRDPTVVSLKEGDSGQRAGGEAQGSTFPCFLTFQ